jgi:hypothetical protein
LTLLAFIRTKTSPAMGSGRAMLARVKGALGPCRTSASITVVVMFDPPRSRFYRSLPNDRHSKTMTKELKSIQ